MFIHHPQHFICGGLHWITNWVNGQAAINLCCAGGFMAKWFTNNRQTGTRYRPSWIQIHQPLWWGFQPNFCQRFWRIISHNIPQTICIRHITTCKIRGKLYSCSIRCDQKTGCTFEIDWSTALLQQMEQ